MRRAAATTASLGVLVLCLRSLLPWTSASALLLSDNSSSLALSLPQSASSSSSVSASAAEAAEAAETVEAGAATDVKLAPFIAAVVVVEQRVLGEASQPAVAADGSKEEEEEEQQQQQQPPPRQPPPSPHSPQSPPPPPPPPRLPATPAALQRRQQNNNCPSNYGACVALNAAGVCCTAGTDCQLDQAGNVACCPRGASCTGTIDIGGATRTGVATNAFIVPATTTGVAPVPASTTTTTTAAINSALTLGVTNNNNQYYGFVAIATPFSNPQLCSSAFASCQTEYNKCTAALGGLGAGGVTGVVNGVTVTGVGGGITFNGATATLNLAAATSVCQSLSAQACRGLQLANCVVTGVRPAAAAALRPPHMPAFGLGGSGGGGGVVGVLFALGVGVVAGGYVLASGW